MTDNESTDVIDFPVSAYARTKSGRVYLRDYLHCAQCRRVYDPEGFAAHRKWTNGLQRCLPAHKAVWLGGPRDGKPLFTRAEGTPGYPDQGTQYWLLNRPTFKHDAA